MTLKNTIREKIEISSGRMGLSGRPLHKRRIVEMNPQPQQQSSEIKRAERVTWLLGGVVGLSIADLALTVSYLTSVGMSEGNPIAVWLLEMTNSIWPLAIYKCITVAVCVLLLYKTRFKREGELASWSAFFIMMALTIWWNQYSRYQPNLPVGENHIVLVDGQLHQPYKHDKQALVMK